DGYLDIYVSVTGDTASTPKHRANLLFINNGHNTFTESAAQYGLADTGLTAQTALCDYDGDNDLAALMINNDPGLFRRNPMIRNQTVRNNENSKSIDVLYRNNGDGTFTDVSH